MTTKRLVGICTHAGSHRKQACRRTWMRDGATYPDLEIVFFQGGASHAHRVGDTVHLPVSDDYKSLDTKVVRFLAYCMEEFEFEHVFKCDDDTYVHLPRLMATNLAGIDYAGFDYRGRGSATGGGGYWLSRRAAQIVTDAVSHGPGIDEDVLVGFVLRRAGVTLHHLPSLPPGLEKPYDPRRAPLPWNEQVTGHYVSPEQMYAVRAQWAALSDDAPSMVVRRALWGTGAAWIDVTGQIAGLGTGALSVLAPPSSRLGDPAPGKHKSLVIDIELGGIVQQLVIGQDFSFVLLKAGPLRTAPDDRPAD